MSDSMPALPMLKRGSNYSSMEMGRSSSMSTIGSKRQSQDFSQAQTRRIQLDINKANSNAQPPWCGRQEELETMMDIFGRMLEHKQAASVLIEGAAGNGKTRFLDIFRERAMISDTKRIFREQKKEKFPSQPNLPSGSSLGSPLIGEEDDDEKEERGLLFGGETPLPHGLPRPPLSFTPAAQPQLPSHTTQQQDEEKSIMTLLRRASTGTNSISPSPQQYNPHNQPAIFCSSRFEEGSASRPLAPIIECFLQLTDALLISNESRKFWKSRLAVDLTTHAQTLLSVLPKMEDLLFVDGLFNGNRRNVIRNSFRHTTKLSTAGASLDSAGLIVKMQQAYAKTGQTSNNDNGKAEAFLKSLRQQQQQKHPLQNSIPNVPIKQIAPGVVKTNQQSLLDDSVVNSSAAPPAPPQQPPWLTPKTTPGKQRIKAVKVSSLEGSETEPPSPQRALRTPRSRKPRISVGLRRNRTALFDNSLDESSSHCTDTGGGLDPSETGSVTPNGNVTPLRTSYRLNTKLVNYQTQSAQEQRRNAERIRFALREFLRCVSRELAIVFTIEDVERAGPESVAMLRALLADPKLSSRRFLFVTTYRPLQPSHPLQNLIQSLSKLSKESRSITRCHNITLDVLTESDVVELVSRLLKREKDDVQELGNLVYSKTAGNAFFVVEFVRLLDQKELVKYSVLSCRWEWAPLSKISAEMDTSDNVVDVVAEKIRSASQDVKLALLTAAAFSVSRFSSQTIFKAIPSESDGANSLIRRASSEIQLKQKVSGIPTLEALICLLEEAVDDGYLASLGGFEYKFTHDRVREAAITLLPHGVDLNILRLRMGRQLRKWLREMEQESVNDERLLVQVVVLMNQASYLIQDNEEKVDLSNLNYTAAERAIERSSFFPASEFLCKAIDLLGDSDHAWNNHYSTMMKLSDELMRTDYCCGRLAESIHIADQILLHGKAFDEKKTAYHMKALWFVQNEKIDESLELILSALEELGAPVPSRFLRCHKFVSYHRIRLKLRGKSNLQLLSLPASSDPQIEDVGNFMERLEEVANLSGLNNLLEVAMLRKVSLTLHQRFTMTPTCLVSWGIFHARMGKCDEAHRFGKLGVQLANEEVGGYHDARAILMYYMYIFHWRTPYHDGIGPTSDALKRLWDLGAIEYVFRDTITYLLIYFCCGLRLAPLAQDIRNYVELLRDYSSPVDKHLPFFQCIANLMVGQSSDEQSDIVEDSSELNDLVSLWAECDTPVDSSPKSFFYRMMLSYFFNDIETAVKLANRISSPLEEEPDVILPFRLFFHGMTYLSSFNTTKNYQELRGGQRIIAQMQQWTSDGNPNAHHMLSLLQAEERAGTHKDFDKVRHLYDEAISKAGRLGFLHFHALANERCALFCLRRGEEEWASGYLKKAQSLYSEWGAHFKVRRMTDEYNKYLPRSTDGLSSQGTAIKSVSRLGLLSKETYKKDVEFS